MTSSPTDLRRLLERNEQVFPTHPQVARYFAAACIEDARQRLNRSIERGNGPALIVGGAGTGKSLLLQVLAAQFQERFDVVLLACTRLCTRRALLQAMLFELGLPYRLRDEGELRLSMLDHLLTVEKCPAGLLVLVDEAQALSPALLDELRVMTNLVRGGAPRVRLVLAGSLVLEESFANPELESFSQRLSARCYLAPFSRDETAQFIRAQVAASGGEPDEVFVDDSYAAIFDATDGVPRLVCQLCDRALLMAASSNRNRIDRDLIQAAWADFQQLPTPWDSPSTPGPSTSPSESVEFGAMPLDELSEGLIDEPAADTDATELDTIEDPCKLSVLNTDIDDSAVGVKREESSPPATDPFAEEFDEEEVVIDCFAAWDDMFRRDAPRVENRRDPRFADLVQAAIDAMPTDPTAVGRATSPIGQGISSDWAGAAPEKSEPFVFHTNDLDNMSPDVPEEIEHVESQLTDWPRLRLAMVSEQIPLRPMSLIAPASKCRSLAFDPAWIQPAIEIDDWPDPLLRSTPGATFLGNYIPAAERAAQAAEPILVIEEDTPIPCPNETEVRYEEYRHLFSRLRSG